MRRLVTIAASSAALTAVLVACDNGALTDPPSHGVPTPAAVEVLDGAGQEVPVNALTHSFVVQVRDQDGNPLADTRINWGYEADGPDLTFARSTTSTNVDGRAANVAVVGTVAGPLTVTAAVEGSALDPAEIPIDVTPSAPATLEPAASVWVGQPETTVELAAYVRDAHGNGVPGIGIDWQAPAGTILSTQPTDETGRATAMYRLPSAPQRVDVVARDTAHTLEAVLQARSADLSLSVHGGNNQQVPAGQESATALQVIARDVGGPSAVVAPGVEVHWTAPPGVTLTETVSRTDDEGIAETRVVAGDNVGAYAVTAAAGSATPAVFSVSVTGPNDAMHWEILSGNGQHGPAGTELPVPFQVRVLDYRGVPVSGVDINWRRTSSTGSIGASMTTTDATGVAQVSGTLGATDGDSLQVEATASFFADTLTFLALTTSAGEGHYLEMPTSGSGNEQSGVAGYVLPHPTAVLVLDENRHPVEGVQVQWEVLSGGGWLGQSGNGAAISYTGANGIATMTWSLGDTIGKQQIQAHVPGLQPDRLVFDAYATSENEVATLEAAAWSTVIVPACQALPNPPAVVALDTIRARVPDVVVNWDLSRGAGVIDAGVSLTGTDGISTMGYTAPDHRAVDSLYAYVSPREPALETLFLIDVTHPPARVEVPGDATLEVSGDSTELAQGVPFPQMGVEVRSAANTPVPNAIVTWSAENVALATMNSWTNRDGRAYATAVTTGPQGGRVTATVRNECEGVSYEAQFTLNVDVESSTSP